MQSTAGILVPAVLFHWLGHYHLVKFKNNFRIFFSKILWPNAQHHFLRSCKRNVML